LTLQLQEPLAAIPSELDEWSLAIHAEGYELEYSFDANADNTGIPQLLKQLNDLGVGYKDLNTQQSSLEEIFVNLVKEKR